MMNRRVVGVWMLTLGCLLLVAPSAAVAKDKNAVLVTVDTVSAFPETTIGAAAALEIARLAATRGWKSKDLADRERVRLYRLLRDSLATAATLVDGALKAHKDNGDAVKRLETARKVIGDTRALLPADSTKGAVTRLDFRAVSRELDKAWLAAHVAATTVNKRAGTMVKMAVLQGLIGKQGVVAVIGEKGLEGVVALLGPHGSVDVNAVVGTNSLVTKIAAETKSIDKAGAESLEAARKAVMTNLKAPAPTLAVKLDELAAANASLIATLSAPAVQTKTPSPAVKGLDGL